MTTPHIEHKTGYWWFFLALTGALSMTFNLWMAIAPPAGVSAGEVATNLVLGIIAHAAPVGLSAMASHGFKTPLLGGFERGVIVGLFLLFMLMSVSTQASLLEHGAHLLWVWAWSLPLAIDVLALLSLRAILTAHRLNREAKIARDVAAERAAVALDIRPDIEADIRRQFEGKLPALREDIQAAVWRDIWTAMGGDIPADTGTDIMRNLTVLAERIREAVLRQQEEEFTARDRKLAAKWDVERIDFEDKIRQEEQEEALARWEAAEKQLESQIEFRLRRELRSGNGGGSKRKAITGGQSAAPKVTMEKGMEIVRQALLDGDRHTNAELAEMIGRDAKTVIRYKKKIREEMGLDDGEDDADDTSGTGRLRAV